MPNHAQGGEARRKDWKAPSAPHGYDQCEFEPAREAGPPKRVRARQPDEERQRLHRLQATMDSTGSANLSERDEDAARDPHPDEIAESGRARLYRE